MVIITDDGSRNMCGLLAPNYPCGLFCVFVFSVGGGGGYLLFAPTKDKSNSHMAKFWPCTFPLLCLREQIFSSFSLICNSYRIRFFLNFWIFIFSIFCFMQYRYNILWRTRFFELLGFLFNYLLQIKLLQYFASYNITWYQLPTCRG